MVPKDFRGWEGRNRMIDQRVWWGRQSLLASLYPSRSLMTFSSCYFCTLECCTTIPTLMDAYDMQAWLRCWYYMGEGWPCELGDFGCGEGGYAQSEAE